MTLFAGSGTHPLLLDWMTWLQDQSQTWASESAILASRATMLAANDPFCAALVATHLQFLGPNGLRFQSGYDAKPEDNGTDEASRQIRRQISALSGATWYGRDLDAERARSRFELEKQLAWMAFVQGDGFAIRIWRGGRNRWRIITPERVANPAAMPNDDRLRDGFQLDADGGILGIWVHRGTLGPFGATMTEKPVFVQWYAPDGTPNVIHRTGLRLPGMLRGVSRLAPMVIMCKQLSGVLESHVAAKRLQAVFGMIIDAESPEDYEEAMADGTALASPNMRVKGPLNVWVKPPGSTAQFTDPKFNGADLTAYLEICYRVQCATASLPVDVVLCQMGKASLSSARAGLDQYDRTCQTEQEAHISEATSPIDRAEVGAAIATGALVVATTDPAQVMAGKYTRPPKYSTDRKKDAETMAALQAAGVSQTTSLEIFGFSHEDEVERKVAEQAFEEAQGFKRPAAPAAIAPAPAPAPNPADGEQDQPPVDENGDPVADPNKEAA